MFKSKQDLMSTAIQNPATSGPTSLSENVAAAFEEQFFNQTTIGADQDLFDRYQALIGDIEKRTGERLENPIRPKVAGSRIGPLNVFTDRIERSRREQELGFQQKVDKLREKHPDLPFASATRVREEANKAHPHDVKPEDMTDEAFEAHLKSLPITIGPEATRVVVRELRKERRRRLADVAAGSPGVVGGTARFLGSTAGALSEPVVLGSMLFGAGAASGVLRTALVEAGIGVASETVAQIQVQTGREQFGEKASLEEAIENVGFAAAGGAILGGGIAGVRSLLRRFRAEIPANQRTPEMRAAEDVIQRQADLESLRPFEDTPAGRVAHQERLDEAMISLSEGRPARLGDTDLPTRSPSARVADEVGAIRTDPDAFDIGRAQEIGQAVSKAVRETPVASSPIEGASVTQVSRAAEAAPEGSRGIFVEETAEIVEQARTRFQDEPDRVLNLEDEAGNPQSKTAREVFETIDNDRQLADEVADCFKRSS